jgi:hypothetical protein
MECCLRSRSEAKSKTSISPDFRLWMKVDNESRGQIVGSGSKDIEKPQSALRMSLGPLEARVMTILWTCGKCTADSAWGPLVQALEASTPCFFVPKTTVEYVLFSDTPEDRLPRITSLG